MKSTLCTTILLIFAVLITNIKINAQGDPGPNLFFPTDGLINVEKNATFSWETIAGANQYIINISTDSLFSTLTINKTVDTTIYTATSLQFNQVYYWRVQARVDGVLTDFSDFYWFKIKLSTPVLLLPSSAAVNTPVNTSLTWNAVSGANNYTIDVSVKSDFSDSVDTYNNVAAVKQDLTALSYYTTYYWRVRANQAGGLVSDYSITRNFTTIKAGPTLTSPANNSLNYKFTKVTYNWAALPDVDSYELQVCKVDSFKGGDLETYSNIFTNSYTPSDYISYNTQYYWRVRGKKASVYTDYSSTFKYTTGTPATAIEDADVKIDFIHTQGEISGLLQKHNNKQLLNAYLNNKNKTGFCRITNETNTKLASWVENAGDYTYVYDNLAYGSKTVNIKWDSDSIIVRMTVNINPNRSINVNAAWLPGEDTGPLYDSIYYATPSGELTKARLSYPGVSNQLFSGYTSLVAMSDSRYSDQIFGFFNYDSMSTLLTQGVGFGPSYSVAAKTTAQTAEFYFGVMDPADFFAWAGKKYILVTYPEAGITLKDQSAFNVKWESFNAAGNVNITLSTDGGGSWAALALNTPNDGIQAVTLPDLSADVPLSNCIVRIGGVGATAYSGVFSIVYGNSTVFTVPSGLTGAPTDKVAVPVLVTPVSGDSINAFDIRLEYNKDILTYLNSSVDPELTAKNWITDVTNNTSLGFVQMGGFKNDAGLAVTANDTLFVVNFSIKSGARVGVQSPLRINNQYLSAADDSVQALNVIGVDGYLTVYSRISGNLTYIISKRPIVGDSLVQYININTLGAEVDTAYSSTTTAGFFNFTNCAPGGTVSIVPVTNLPPPVSITSSVDAGDAAKAFAGRDGGSVTLTELQKIAADVNEDGFITSTDALAILNISTEAFTASDYGFDNWIFVDSTFKLTSANWSSAPRTITYQPLDTVKNKQSFWGVVRGDVDGDGYYNPSIGFSAPFDINNAAIEYSVPSDITALPGDTVYLPLNVKLNNRAIGAFNVSLSVDKNLLTYTGRYSEGESFPTGKGWYISTHFDSKGNLNVGATDFSGTLDPILFDGTIAVFEFVVNGSAEPGDTSRINFSYISASDVKLVDLTASGIDGKVTVSTPTSVNNENIIYEYKLEQNYPNPFNPSTVINYSIAKESRVNIEIFNSLGERILILFNNVQSPGYYSIKWDASKFASGIYFYRIQAGDFALTRKMMLIK